MAFPRVSTATQAHGALPGLFPKLRRHYPHRGTACYVLSNPPGPHRYVVTVTSQAGPPGAPGVRHWAHPTEQEETAPSRTSRLLQGHQPAGGSGRLRKPADRAAAERTDPPRCPTNRQRANSPDACELSLNGGGGTQGCVYNDIIADVIVITEKHVGYMPIIVIVVIWVYDCFNISVFNMLSYYVKLRSLNIYSTSIGREKEAGPGSARRSRDQTRPPVLANALCGGGSPAAAPCHVGGVAYSWPWLSPREPKRPGVDERCVEGLCALLVTVLKGVKPSEKFRLHKGSSNDLKSSTAQARGRVPTGQGDKETTQWRLWAHTRKREFESNLQPCSPAAGRAGCPQNR